MPTGRTGYKLLRQQLRGLRNPDLAARHVQYKIWGLQLVMLGASIAAGVWWLYPVFWLLPFLTVWRVINRLRSIAEHGGMTASKDRRVHHPLGAPTPASCSSRTASAGTSPTTWIPASRSATCPAFM